MNVNDMYQICQFAINKAQNGYLKPTQFNLIINQAQTSFQDYLLGEFQQYQYGRPQARVNYSQNSDTRQRLTPLITELTLTVDANGEADYPADYLQVDAVRNVSTFDRIRFVQQDSLYSYIKSQIDPVASNPIYLLTDQGFKFYPINIGTARLTYVANAPEILWAYTNDVNNRPVYDPLTSVDPVWYDVDKLEIVARALKLVGLNLQIGQLEQYANQVTQTGQ